ncbi:protein FAM83G isoform 4-T4 [Aulostomus maculatus]
MALSQIQCLDNNHVNPRTHESKPEFLYSEDQRLALEALLKDGREAFVKYVEARGLRGFLSDLEQDALTGTAEPYDPGLDIFPEGAEEDEPPLSLHYWPELSDMSIPQMDLGWPDSDAYRGVTRTTVYTQPPLDGQAHVKEIVRKMIAQAQKVIAVVMDVFTDVDIFRDLLDAGFKRRVSVYILLERTALPHFLSMCQRAQMHAGHLKHLRVRCTDGTEFYTRSCTKVRGRMGHRFMFIDGDKAVSGSYSFTWTSSRLDRNLITVVTGHAVDTFDRLFRCLYMNSSFVDLRQVATVPAPEPEPIPQPAAVAPLPAALARKMHNPKYALVFVENPSPTPTTDPCADQESPKEAQNLTNSQKGKKRRAIKEALEENVPLHPGLSNLEKACLISYLPTWPEPDPPSDVIGFINVRDSSKPTKVHLQRSERFETSQAIRFSSPFSMPKEVLPEVAKPRQRTTEPVGVSKPRATQDKAKEQDSRAFSPPRPTQPSRPTQSILLMGPRPWGSQPLNQAESKVLQSSSQGYTSSTQKMVSRTSPLQAAGHKQPDVSQKSPLAQGRARAGQDQRSYLKHSNMQQLFPHSQSHTVSTQETHRHLDGKLPFSVTFSRLYSLKGLKDKMSKLPAHSKRSSTSSPVQGHKKTS